MNYESGSEWRRWDLHVHTATSYDYNYNASDADQMLCNTLIMENIEAVAITDHFKIDSARIKNLRVLAPQITFFPGVELRTDKGASNLHIIIIFSEQTDIDTLSADFDAIMLRQKAKSKESNDTIYWNFDDIIDFAKFHDGLISIHAGRKTNGLDKEITNALPVKEAIKKEIADCIHFFEVGKQKDIQEYHDIVFKEIEEKPIIMCSDCHDPRQYAPKECLWIKANTTFEGLKQCLYQPQERIFVGSIPPTLDRARRNAKSNIKSVSVHQIDTPKNTIVNWFDFDLKLNSGLIAIIGNKGSGKSALSDIIGHLCKCSTMDSASFLNPTRFRRPPKNYADDYFATICWSDSHSEAMTLSVVEYDTSIENAQYLPQKYIEEVCNDIDNVFQNEIDKVIFSYVDKTERGTAKNLHELVSLKSNALEFALQKLKSELSSINDTIIKLEEKKTVEYKKRISDSLKKMKETLDRHIKSKPAEVDKPIEEGKNTEYQKQLSTVNNTISALEEEISLAEDQLTSINADIDEFNQLIARIDLLESDINDINHIIEDFLVDHPIEEATKITIVTPKEKLEMCVKELSNKKLALQKKLYGSDIEETGLILRLKQAKKHKDELVSSADSEEKKYQKYLSDLDEWEKERVEIIGSISTEDTLEYFENELKYLETQLDLAYEKSKTERIHKIEEVYRLKQSLVIIYQEIYSPVEAEITRLLGDLDENIAFAAEIQMCDVNLADNLLAHINQRYAGLFKGKTESQNKMNQLIRKTEFNRIESVIEFIREILQVVDESIEDSSKKIADKKEFYKLLSELDYVGVSYKLRMGGRDLEELSPGERGIVLLVFYLALSQNNVPIIIDQPEDNLDNQSVFSKLVPCICAAKKKRQVIIVTHNPNIAIACDAEQIVFCQMNKTSHSIEYLSGAIEDTDIRQHVVDVLEGTMPAFDLRKRKYAK